MRFSKSFSPAGAAILALAVGLGGCGKIEPNDRQEPGRIRAEAKRQQARCASSVAYDRLKGLLFDQATARYRGDRANLDTLADYSTARMENPVVDRRDAALDITGCKGRFILDIPPGAERAFAGERRLQADVSYTAQAAADGNGFVYQLSGAEPIVSRLAAFNLTSGAFQPPPAIDQSGDTPAPVALAQADAPLLPPRPQAVPQAAPGAADSAPPRDTQAPVRGRKTDDADRPHRVDPTAQASGDTPRPSGASGEATVRAFYAALRAGDGNAASARIISEKRASGSFSPGAMTRFYGKLAEPVQVREVVAVSPGAYRVSYSYAAGRSRCNGSAIVSLTNRGGSDLIRSIRALNGC
ncbi:hypothetical protein [Sphingomonas endolithica]|uniref:hypothetical protein n=1 Tax=Sphingomonas endolithica TaxID=2972485 RepID=UPI0021AFA72D|nr:hypothetical protein [Sphingomonas sp. ZFBP2030]